MDPHMRPRLLADVRFAECPEGVIVYSGLGSQVLSGRHIYRWLTRIAPELRGDRMVADLTQSLDEARRDMVYRLVNTLTRNGFVVDEAPGEAHTLAEREVTEYAAEIASIRYRHGSAEWRFQQLRNARILLCGRGPLVTDIAAMGLRSGWRRLDVLADIDGDLLLSQAVRDPEQRVRVESGADPRSRVADLVIQVATGDNMTELVEGARWYAGAALQQVLVRDDDVWCTPIYVRDHALAAAGWRWLASPSGPGQRVPELPSPASRRARPSGRTIRTTNGAWRRPTPFASSDTRRNTNPSGTGPLWPPSSATSAIRPASLWASCR